MPIRVKDCSTVNSYLIPTSATSSRKWLKSTGQPLSKELPRSARKDFCFAKPHHPTLEEGVAPGITDSKAK